MRRQSGLTLVELMITMVIFLIVIAAMSNIFVSLLGQFKQQSQIVATNIEGAVGLEIMRRDIESAGYGLAWNLDGAAYTEAVDSGNTAQDEQDYNDGPNNNPARGTDPAGASNPPGALRSGNNEGQGGSDVLVIKAVNIATNSASSKWTHLHSGNTVTVWQLPTGVPPNIENLENNDWAIVQRFGGNDTTLVSAGGTYKARYSAGPPAGLTAAGFAPLDSTETRVVYGIAPSTAADIRMPFNRTDYYLRTPAAPADMPTKCAAGTGILYKGTVNHADGNLTELPLLDCVADMQVAYGLDTDGDGTVNTTTDDISTLTALEVRQQVRQVRVDILAQEGQRDPAFTFGTNPMYVGFAGMGRSFNFTTSGITDWQRYRWRLYTISISPDNLR